MCETQAAVVSQQAEFDWRRAMATSCIDGCGIGAAASAARFYPDPPNGRGIKLVNYLYSKGKQPPTDYKIIK